MNWKEFFKPTKGKIIFTVILSVILFLLQYLLVLYPEKSVTLDNGIIVLSSQQHGFPFIFSERECSGFPHPKGKGPDICDEKFYLHLFIINLILWVIVAYLVSFIIIRKKK